MQFFCSFFGELSSSVSRGQMSTHSSFFLSLSFSVCLPLLLPLSFLSQQPSPSRKSCVRYPPPPPPPLILAPDRSHPQIIHFAKKCAYFENSSRCTFRFGWNTAFRGRRQFPISANGINENQENRFFFLD